MNREVLNQKFDLTGNEISRVLKLSVLGRVVPIGNLRGGPGARCLAVLALLHYFGYWLYLLNARYGRQIGRLRHLLRRLRG